MLEQKIGNYKILGKIREGSVGVIYKAVTESGKICAIKRIGQANASVGRKLRSFRHEADVLAYLNHKNIIKVFEYVNEKPQPFFSMEYFESENIRYCLHYLPERVSKNEFSILKQIGEAIRYIHSLGIIHRDIKPENILLNDKSEVRLIDFSLAQTRWDRFWHFWPFFFGRAAGSPSYMSPEQIRNTKIDYRSDIYSFGILVFELFAKRQPFIGNDKKIIFEKHLREPVPPLGLVMENSPKGLEDFLQKALAKKPKDRFQNMSDTLYELSEVERKCVINGKKI